ncbi:uncharacterized membrane protein (DUF485 family) [Bradyrhizobium sp. USDA 4518]
MALAEDVIPASLAIEVGAGRDVPAVVARIERARKALVRPLFAFSTAFYLIGLLVLAYLPDVVAFKVFGSINVAYLLALAQFIMTFAVAYIYARRANRLIDPMVEAAFEAVANARKSGVVL